ncbi:MAG TPA: tRNA lysidine(34) synthetase TilS [Candidatus Saccharimonadales bacterium]
MKIEAPHGKYVVAVSGGVDSVVLLHLLQKQGQLELVVAHFDHGIREDSPLDRKFVEDLSKEYGLKFYYDEGHLGSKTSEEKARDARYKFLNDVVKKEQADGLITAHHQDDQIETAIINIIRGTGRKGLSSLTSSSKVLRPLLGYSKDDIRKYALDNKLKWREDPTNQDLKYLRNYIRHKIVPKLDRASRDHLIDLINKQASLNTQIDKELSDVLASETTDNKLPRLWLNSLDNSLSKEILATWLRQNNLRDFNRASLERLSANLKTVGPSKQIDVVSGWQIISTKVDLALTHIER